MNISTIAGIGYGPIHDFGIDFSGRTFDGKRPIGIVDLDFPFQVGDRDGTVHSRECQRAVAGSVNDEIRRPVVLVGTAYGEPPTVKGSLYLLQFAPRRRAFIGNGGFAVQYAKIR